MTDEYKPDQIINPLGTKLGDLLVSMKDMGAQVLKLTGSDTQNVPQFFALLAVGEEAAALAPVIEELTDTASDTDEEDADTDDTEPGSAGEGATAVTPVQEAAANVIPKKTDGDIILDYTNWRGVRSKRRVLPVGIMFGVTEWHPEPQWLLVAFDYDKQAERSFSFYGIHDISQVPKQG